MSKPILWIMVGLSGSGKSSIAKQIVENHPNTIIVSSDSIREEVFNNYEDQSHNEEVFKIFHKRIREGLENKSDVIADATNITMKSRRAILENVNGLNIKKIACILPKPFCECKKDNLDRNHPVPDEVLDKQIRRFQIPFEEEGFDEIEILSCDGWNNYRFSHLDYLAFMYKFDQKNPHHTMMLDKHCMNAYRLFCKKRPSNTWFPQEYFDGYVMGTKLHDIGKLQTQTFDEDGVAHYYNHPEVGAYTLLSQMRTPTCLPSNKFILECCFLVNYHMMPYDWMTDNARERWKKRFGEYKYQLLLDFNECDKAR